MLTQIICTLHKQMCTIGYLLHERMYTRSKALVIQALVIPAHVQNLSLCKCIARSKAYHQSAWEQCTNAPSPQLCLH